MSKFKYLDEKSENFEHTHKVIHEIAYQLKRIADVETGE